MEREELAVIGAAARDDPSRLIVCERTGRWAVALRRELSEAGVRVWETRTVDGCWEELASSPASFVVLELGGDVEEALRRLVRQSREFPAARLAIADDRRHADYRWLVREAGAVHVVASVRRVGPLARLICRHLAQAPAVPRSFAERIWSTLPWGDGG